MSFTFWLLIGIHVVLCLFLVLLVLIQNDKSGGLVGALGGGGAGGSSSYGRGAATFISELTQSVAILFMAVVLGINVVVSQSDTTAKESVLKVEATKEESKGLGSIIPQAAPAAPAIQIDTAGAAK